MYNNNEAKLLQMKMKNWRKDLKLSNVNCRLSFIVFSKHITDETLFGWYKISIKNEERKRFKSNIEHQ